MMDTTGWEEFKLHDICTISMGNKLDLSAMTTDDPAVNFVGRTADNNGIRAKVDLIDGIEPYPAGDITVALGGSIGSSFVQAEPFYTSQNVSVLHFTNVVSTEAKLFICMMIMNECKYKYVAFGRELNIHIRTDFAMRLPSTPSGPPDWEYMENYIKSLHCKPITTQNKADEVPKLDVTGWKEFLLADYFDVVPGIYHYNSEYEAGDTPYVTASNENNGIADYIDLPADFNGNQITIGKVGATAFYQPQPFCATSDVNVFTPKFNMTTYVGLFVSRVINFNENFRWGYGRQCRVGNSKRITVFLPSAPSGEPDWQYMENYIKSLPFGDRIATQ